MPFKKVKHAAFEDPNLRQKIDNLNARIDAVNEKKMPTRKDYAEEMGEGYSRPEKAIEAVRSAGKAVFEDEEEEEEDSYEEDFDSAVVRDELESKIEELKKAYKKLRSDEDKMTNLSRQNKLRARLSQLKE